MRRTRHHVLPVRSWQYIGLMIVSLACLTLGLVSRDREGRAGSLAGPELKHTAPHEVDACPNVNPFTHRLPSAVDLAPNTWIPQTSRWAEDLRMSKNPKKSVTNRQTTRALQTPLAIRRTDTRDVRAQESERLIRSQNTRFERRQLNNDFNDRRSVSLDRRSSRTDRTREIPTVRRTDPSRLLSRRASKGLSEQIDIHGDRIVRAESVDSNRRIRSSDRRVQSLDQQRTERRSNRGVQFQGRRMNTSNNRHFEPRQVRSAGRLERVEDSREMASTRRQGAGGMLNVRSQDRLGLNSRTQPERSMDNSIQGVNFRLNKRHFTRYVGGQEQSTDSARRSVTSSDNWRHVNRIDSRESERRARLVEARMDSHRLTVQSGHRRSVERRQHSRDQLTRIDISTRNMQSNDQKPIVRILSHRLNRPEGLVKKRINGRRLSERFDEQRFLEHSVELNLARQKRPMKERHDEQRSRTQSNDRRSSEPIENRSLSSRSTNIRSEDRRPFEPRQIPSLERQQRYSKVRQPIHRIRSLPEKQSRPSDMPREISVNSLRQINKISRNIRSSDTQHRQVERMLSSRDNRKNNEERRGDVKAVENRNTARNGHNEIHLMTMPNVIDSSEVVNIDRRSAERLSNENFNRQKRFISERNAARRASERVDAQRSREHRMYQNLGYQKRIARENYDARRSRAQVSDRRSLERIESRSSIAERTHVRVEMRRSSERRRVQSVDRQDRHLSRNDLLQERQSQPSDMRREMSWVNSLRQNDNIMRNSRFSDSERHQVERETKAERRMSFRHSREDDEKRQIVRAAEKRNTYESRRNHMYLMTAPNIMDSKEVLPSPSYEVLRQICLLVLCTIYTASLFQQKRGFIKNTLAHAARLIAW